LRMWWISDDVWIAVGQLDTGCLCALRGCRVEPENVRLIRLDPLSSTVPVS
jgi:hypothetical protein